MPTRRLRLRLPQPFELRLCLFGHGWVMLAPHAFDEATQTFTTVLNLGGAGIDAVLRQVGDDALQLDLTSSRRWRQSDADLAAARIRHMLRLDCDLGPFHAMCATDPGLRWAAHRGAGRLLRSASMFEDLMKLLFTTNTSWSATEAMTRNLVAAAGPRSPSGSRAFPTPAQCPREPAFWREVVRVGYRAEAAIELTAGFDAGALDDAHFLAPQPSARLWDRLLALRGFGPYAAGQAMRLCGHYDRLALDSWCRARLAQLAGKRRPPADRTVERRYARWAPFQGLALWLELTADWHGEAPR